MAGVACILITGIIDKIFQILLICLCNMEPRENLAAILNLADLIKVDEEYFLA